MEWWTWILLGLVLLLAEVITAGGFYILFFGVGAVIVGILSSLDLAGPLWLQIVLFPVLSVLSLWLFRERLLHLTQGGSRRDVDSLIGESAVAVDEIGVNAMGKAEMHGTSWNARNVGDKTLARGERCRVDRVDGLTIFVRAEQI
jgi:membrane protein implicated in regulation of membrane protease activity